MRLWPVLMSNGGASEVSKVKQGGTIVASKSHAPSSRIIFLQEYLKIDSARVVSHFMKFNTSIIHIKAQKSTRCSSRPTP